MSSRHFAVGADGCLSRTRFEKRNGTMLMESRNGKRGIEGRRQDRGRTFRSFWSESRVNRRQMNWISDLWRLSVQLKRPINCSTIVEIPRRPDPPKQESLHNVRSLAVPQINQKLVWRGQLLNSLNQIVLKRRSRKNRYLLRLCRGATKS